jgi:hypothetical protein
MVHNVGTPPLLPALVSVRCADQRCLISPSARTAAAIHVMRSRCGSKPVVSVSTTTYRLNASPLADVGGERLRGGRSLIDTITSLVTVDPVEALGSAVRNY